MAWVDEFKYLRHLVDSSLSDSADIRRVKRSLYYGVMICSKVGYADKNILVQLFKSYCCNMYGCELWNLFLNKMAFRELCVAYHSSLKKLVKMPRSSSNHNLCLSLGFLCCMHVAGRQLSVWLRLCSSANTIVSALIASDIGRHGLLAKCHLQLCRVYELLAMDLRTFSPSDITNVFISRLDRFVHERNLSQRHHDPG